MEKSLEKLKDELSASVRGLDSSQTQLRPKERPEAWTIQQIVEHLLLTYASTHSVLEERLAKGVPTKKPVTPKQWLMQCAVTRMGYFPRGKQAPEVVRPSASAPARDGEELAVAIRAESDVLDSLAVRCAGVLGNGRSVTHFILGPMSGAQWMKFHLVHARHHVKQIVGIRREYGV
jgi:hypothetical protein